MDSKELALKIRQHVLQMTHDAKSAHIGSCLSCADILVVLYNDVMKQGDKFILGKGHACAALYATLAECGYFHIEDLKGFYQDGSFLQGHANHYVNGVDVSTGSLGQGLSIACGMALASRKNKVYVLIGEGDLNEGQTWEAAMLASHHMLDNLTVIIDRNKLQALGKTQDILQLNPLGNKWQSFGWEVNWVDGHNLSELHEAFKSLPIKMYRPNCIIAHTVKGKGVSFLENQTESHYHVISDEELIMAMEELK